MCDVAIRVDAIPLLSAGIRDCSVGYIVFWVGSSTLIIGSLGFSTISSLFFCEINYRTTSKSTFFIIDFFGRWEGGVWGSVLETVYLLRPCSKDSILILSIRFYVTRLSIILFIFFNSWLTFEPGCSVVIFLDFFFLFSCFLVILSSDDLCWHSNLPVSTKILPKPNSLLFSDNLITERIHI